MRTRGGSPRRMRNVRAGTAGVSILRHSPAHEEVPKLGVLRANLVEPHVRDDFLEVERVFREKGYAPFPVVETDGASDDLLNAAGKPSAGEAVGLHQAASF